MLFLTDSKRNVCPLAWRSRTIRRVVRSTIAAETNAMIDGLDAAYCAANILGELLGCSIKIEALTDNESLYRNSYATTMTDERRLRVDIAIIKEMILREEVSALKWIPAISQLADSLTKLGADSTKLLAVLETGHIS